MKTLFPAIFILFCVNVLSSQDKTWDVNEDYSDEINNSDTIRLISHNTNVALMVNGDSIDLCEDAILQIKIKDDSISLNICTNIKKYYLGELGVNVNYRGHELKLRKKKVSSTPEPNSKNLNLTKEINVYKDAVAFLDDNSRPFIVQKYGISNTLKNNFLINFKVVSHLQSENDRGSLTKSILNLDVTKYADGFAKFIAARFKEEMYMYFFKKFKASITDTTKYYDVKILFENTFNELLLVDEKIYDYKRYLPSLRTKMEFDASVMSSIN